MGIMDKPSLRKRLLICVGFISVGLATAGVFLPILPTTPFLLLAAACFARSSDRFYQWLITHRLFGRYIRCYRKYRAMTGGAKVLTLVLLWAVMAYTVLAIVHSLPLRVLLLLIALGVTIHVLTLKTLTQEQLADEAALALKEDERAQGAPPDVHQVSGGYTSSGSSESDI
jgi:uncharacterized membrane protein YbaN (DUF454 family)